jgi:DNA-binding IscR family transcriptional regulator
VNREVETDPFPQGDGGRSRVVLEVARAATVDFIAGRTGTTREELAKRIGLPEPWVATALQLLCDGGFFVAADPEGGPGGPRRYLPARPPSTISVVDILTAVRQPEGNAGGARERSRTIDALLARQRATERAALGDVTLEALAAEERSA